MGRVDVTTSSGWSELRARPDGGEIVAVAVTGKPFVFAVGADLTGVPHITERDQHLIARAGHAAYASFTDLPVPTFAFVNGAAMGGGLELALSARYRTISGGAPAVALLPRDVDRLGRRRHHGATTAERAVVDRDGARWASAVAKATRVADARTGRAAGAPDRALGRRATKVGIAGAGLMASQLAAALRPAARGSGRRTGRPRPSAHA